MSGRCVACVLGAWLAFCLADTWQPARAAEPPAGDATPVEQVTVTALKYDEKRLERQIVPRFVETHSVPTSAVEQIARWHGRVCPNATGLKQSFNEAVAQRITAVAQRIGARTAPAGQKCAVNIEVVFTTTPQALVDDIDKRHPWLLGSARSAHDTRVTRAVHSWYTTGTRALVPQQRPMVGFNGPLTEGATPEQPPGLPGSPDVVPDAPYGGGGVPAGLSGSRVGASLRSELVYVLVVVDVRKLLSIPLEAVLDYIALVSLTRINAPGACNELPSILDLLSESCGARARPAALTPADTAFLTALYASELDKNLNIEEGELRDRMMAILLHRQ
jgi:hypothetical protein